MTTRKRFTYSFSREYNPVKEPFFRTPMRLLLRFLWRNAKAEMKWVIVMTVTNHTFTDSHVKWNPLVHPMKTGLTHTLCHRRPRQQTLNQNTHAHVQQKHACTVNTLTQACLYGQASQTHTLANSHTYSSFAAYKHHDCCIRFCYIQQRHSSLTVEVTCVSLQHFHFYQTETET